MTEHTIDNMPKMEVSDVKHYVITFDADGNEVRTEVTEEQVRKDFENSPM